MITKTKNCCVVAAGGETAHKYRKQLLVAQHRAHSHAPLSSYTPPKKPEGMVRYGLTMIGMGAVVSEADVSMVLTISQRAPLR